MDVRFFKTDVHILMFNVHVLILILIFIFMFIYVSTPQMEDVHNVQMLQMFICPDVHQSIKIIQNMNILKNYDILIEAKLLI